MPGATRWQGPFFTQIVLGRLPSKGGFRLRAAHIASGALITGLGIEVGWMDRAVERSAWRALGHWRFNYGDESAARDDFGNCSDAISRIETSTDVYGSSRTACVKLKSSSPIQAGARPISTTFVRARRQLLTATMIATLRSNATPSPPCSIAVATSDACGLNVMNPETPAPHSDGNSTSFWASDRWIDPAPCPATGRSQSRSQPACHQRMRLPALVSNRRVVICCLAGAPGC